MVENDNQRNKIDATLNRFLAFRAHNALVDASDLPIARGCHEISMRAVKGRMNKIIAWIPYSPCAESLVEKS